MFTAFAIAWGVGYCILPKKSWASLIFATSSSDKLALNKDNRWIVRILSAAGAVWSYWLGSPILLRRSVRLRLRRADGRRRFAGDFAVKFRGLICRAGRAHGPTSERYCPNATDTVQGLRIGRGVMASGYLGKKVSGVPDTFPTFFLWSIALLRNVQAIRRIARLWPKCTRPAVARGQLGFTA